MSRAVPRTPDSCGLLPWELVVALVRIREKASQVPIPRAAARREWIPAASVPGRTRSHQGEDAGPAADPAGISRQVGAERLHHLAASRPKSAPLAPERGSQVLPRRPGWGGHDGEAAYRGPPSARAWGRGKLRAKTPLLVPKVGHPGDVQRGEGRRAATSCSWSECSGSPIHPPCPPPSEKKGWTHSPA